jgi:hypothetical protein
MKWICCRDHFFGPSAFSPPEPYEAKSLPEFVLHWVWHRPHILGRLVRIGVIDSSTGDECGELMWRLDFWNSDIRRKLAEHERRAWERLRADAVRRWGWNA